MKAAFDSAVTVAQVAAQQMASALAAGATIVINGVATATSKVVAASGTVADALQDAAEDAIDTLDPTNW
ncbi:MAG TPA: hypothetical protein VHE35_08185 [Kofleriaceae bacterium]|nr:hypothetical protein [Kofleriaceae bacterium]